MIQSIIPLLPTPSTARSARSFFWNENETRAYCTHRIRLFQMRDYHLTTRRFVHAFVLNTFEKRSKVQGYGAARSVNTLGRCSSVQKPIVCNYFFCGKYESRIPRAELTPHIHHAITSKTYNTYTSLLCFDFSLRLINAISKVKSMLSLWWYASSLTRKGRIRQKSHLQSAPSTACT